MRKTKAERWLEHLDAKKRKPKKKKVKKKQRVKYQTIITDVKQRAEKVRLSQIKYNSVLERRFRKKLDENEIVHVWQKVFFTDYRYACVDFYIPEKKIVVELDGSYHDAKGQDKKDADRTKWLLENFDIKDVIRIHYMEFNGNYVEENILDLLD